MLSRMARIAIIGGGSIGEALLSGMLRAGRHGSVKARYNLGVTCVLAADQGCAREEYESLKVLAPSKAAKLAALMAERKPGGKR